MDVLYIPQLDEIGSGGEGGNGEGGGTADTVTAAARTRFSLSESEITAILAESAAD